MSESSVKMDPGKRPALLFLAGFFGLYVVVSLTLNLTLGPPGMSKAYLQDNGADHDRYLQITKDPDPAYKRWSQRPELNPPDDALAHNIAFVEEYTARPKFLDEQRRRFRYDMLLDFFNVAMVIALAVRFGRKPLVGLLDKMAGDVRDDIDRAGDSEAQAQERMSSARRRLDGLEDEQAALQHDAEDRIGRMRRESALATGRGVSALNKETEDRKRNEEALARRALARELVDQAIEKIVERVQSETGHEVDDLLIRGFAEDLGRKS